MIKLLIILPTLDQSGAEKQFALLACRFPREQFDVRVVALTRGGPYEKWLQQHGIPYSIFRKRWRLDPITIFRLRRIVQEFRPDATLSCLFSANTAIRLATRGLKQRPVTIISERCVDSWKSGWQLWLDRRLQSRADQLVANSQSVSEFYQGIGFPAEKIRVIPNGVEQPAQPVLSRAELCRELRIPVQAKLIVFAGRLAPQKRLKTLLWATQILRQADDRAYFLLIGDGPQRFDLECYARDVESGPHVRFLGHRHDASSLLHHCDVFWLASEFEGMSNSLMEAMACGKPAVVSNIPPNRELIQHDQQGYLIDGEDSIGYSQYTQRIIQDDALAARLGQAGQARMLNEFSVEQMIGRYANLVSQLVDSAHTTR